MLERMPWSVNNAEVSTFVLLCIVNDTKTSEKSGDRKIGVGYTN